MEKVFEAIRNGDIEALEELLLDEAFDIDGTDDDGLGLLDHCTDPRIEALLIRLGATRRRKKQGDAQSFDLFSVVAQAFMGNIKAKKNPQKLTRKKRRKGPLG